MQRAVKELTKAELRAIASEAVASHSVTRVETNKRTYNELELVERLRLTREERAALDALKFNSDEQAYREYEKAQQAAYAARYL